MANAAIPYVAGFYRDQRIFMDACTAAVASKQRVQVFTPYPVHGLDAILGFKRSLIGRPVFAVILIGFALGMHLCWFTMSQDWPLNVGGKPYFSWPTFMVVALETGLLLGALTNLLLGFHFCRLLPDLDTRLINDRITDDTFCLVLSIGVGQKADELTGWLLSHGAEEAQAFLPTPPHAAHGDSTQVETAHV